MLDQLNRRFKDKTRFLKSVFNRGKNVLLNPLSDLLKGCGYTVQKSRCHVTAHFFHNGRRRVDTEQVFDSVHDRVNNVFFQPGTNIFEETDNSFSDTCHNVAANFFDRFPVCVKQGFTERDNNVVHNELTDTGKSSTHCRPKVVPGFLEVLAFNIFVPPRSNVIPDTREEPEKKLNA